MEQKLCEIFRSKQYGLGVTDVVEKEFDYLEQREKAGESIPNTHNSDFARNIRRWNPPVLTLNSNGLRKCTKKCEVLRGGMALKNLYNVELLRYRACGQQYLLTEDRLIFHLLAFIDLHHYGPEAYNDPPFFSVCNDAVMANSNYRYTYENPRSRYSHEHFVNVATPYLSTHVELREIVGFVDNLEESKSPPVFWQVFLVFIRGFFASYRKSVSMLRNSKRLNIVNLLERTKPIRECVHLIHLFVSSSLEVHNFEWAHIEIAWNNLFTLMSDCAGLTEAERSIVIQLQELYIELLLRIMDHLYCFGEVPQNWQEHFILYNDPSDPELLITRSERCVDSPLWNDKLLSVVLRGVQTRVRLGACVDITPVYSSLFYDNIKAKNLDTGYFISFHDFFHAFECAAIKLTRLLSNELLTRIQHSGLLHYWNDMKEITCGSVAHCFAALVYGCSSDLSKFGALDISQSYRNALIRGGVSSARAINWRLTHAAASDTDYSLHCDFGFPLKYVFRPSLLPSINACMDKVFKIYRVVELLTSVCSDRKIMEDYHQSHDGVIAKKRMRHMFFIVSKLLNMTSIIKDLFVGKVASVFNNHRKVLENAEEVEEVDNTLCNAELELQSLVARTNIRKQFHEVVDILKHLAEEIRLKSISNDLTSEALMRWHKTTVRTVEFLALVGAAMPVDSLFHTLHLRLAYSHEHVRYPCSVDN